MDAAAARLPTQEELTDGVRSYYDGQKDDRNLLLGGATGLVNHHFGLGDFERRGFPNAFSQHQIASELHGLELNEIDRLIAEMGPIRRSSRILDAGCGRGGTAFTLADRYGARVTGITISPYQCGFAKELNEEYVGDGSVDFRVLDYLELDYPDVEFEHVITNETTQYTLELPRLFRGFARVLKPGGNYTLATWCRNERADDEAIARAIDDNYGTLMHTRAEYLAGLDASGFELERFVDCTADALPYWELREYWEESSGVERPFIDGHRSRAILYLIISARRR
jgi:geranyl diphosphate 2-C-methyltransferase